MITSDRMAAVDANAAALGVPRKQLMESSGNAVARAVRERTEPGDALAIVAGRGNNGGDAFVAARFLEDRDLTTLLLGRAETITTDIARENWDALQQAEQQTIEVRDTAALAGSDADAAAAIDEADLVVDAMLGTGVTGALREPAATATERINDASDAGATVVAVDVPSGVDADTGDAAGDGPHAAVEADHVVTFHDEKPGLADVAATVEVADIGIPDAAELFVGPGDLQALSRPEDSHKGDFGHVLVVGGGPYTGAPALTAQAALRAGADLATVACPESVADEVQGYSESIITKPLPGDRLLPGHVDRLLDLAADRTTTVIGPGLGRAEDTLDAAREFLAAASGTVVVDADPLRVVPDVVAETDATLLCTPHRGELVAMGGPEADDWRDRADAVEAFASDLGATLLVKGPYDVISGGETTRVNRTGNPGMTAGGTGDVLAGITGALVSTQRPVDAGAIAAYVNGTAGDAVVDERGYGMLASDLLAEIPLAMWGKTDG
ncbi:yjef-like protein, hydroxyethylthiazole kinase-related protein [Salinarchaeum sp. Harcht-Bsk1]|uniref:bifunctional ADP-dependent NAD(P)H-hydrate dehydratase/NAD(P)H-hydrate epimerase n=1 Tax=Salinarchaeum sp. Harcht-Bsk1 TaxID=1333523 RepID=UPI00034233C4|nr:bifunctional ADP-dependent NAD(P)H-hydrate dehydratase/NAD(P)H-hydrate epimerase [Salinarchaeum sp. Harcht-Bsk1]AGN00517.1 yjef-like protein, hydroxyethylthiazole kinase-related protein [Salinarchaeum sp. Harcht-Bsk1]